MTDLIAIANEDPRLLIAHEELSEVTATMSVDSLLAASANMTEEEKVAYKAGKLIELSPVLLVELIKMYERDANFHAAIGKIWETKCTILEELLRADGK